LLSAVQHNRGRHRCQRLIRDDPWFRRRQHSPRLDTCNSRLARCSQKSRQDFRSAGIGQVTKRSVLPSLELFLQSEPLAMIQSKDQGAAHGGDVFAGVQSVLFAGDESPPTIPMSYGRRVHISVAPELDVGIFRQSAAILLSEDLRGFHFATNGILAEQVQGDIRRALFAQALSIFHSLGKFTISGELWHFSQPFKKGKTVGSLCAVSRARRKNLGCDVGFNRAFTKTFIRWEAFVGFTCLLAHRLWIGRPGFQP
jgi:hypothetical protein